MTSVQRPSYSLKYRPDIDGLRAISILGVLVFHYFPDMLRGGFVGVDVFFAISGFLIGGLIFDEIGQGSFSFASFYARRVRRIFPALIVVIAVTYAAGWFILFPEEFQQLGDNMAAAALFVSNFALLRQSGYFDAAFQTKPLLHLWSLAIEEQFYILWPLYVWFAFRSRRLFGALTIVLCLLSFAACIALESTAAFYLPVSRFWEILSGSLLAYLVRRPLPSIVVKWRGLCSWPGLALIVVAFMDTTAQDFPGWHPLLPVLGACLILFAGPDAWLNRYVLASRGMVFIGLISYPLYLWHWPLISFAWIIDGSSKYDAVYGQGPATAAKLWLIAASFVLACLTYFLVERPVRFGGHRRFKVAAMAALLLTVGVAGGVTMIDHGIPSRTVAEINQVIAEDIKFPTDTRTADGSCPRLLGGVVVDGISVCLTTSDKPIVMFIGDSESMALYSAIFRRLVKIPAVLVASSDKKAACTDPSPDFAAWMAGPEPCQQQFRGIFKILETTPSIRTVVIQYQRDGPVYRSRDKIEHLQAEVLKDEGRDLVYILGQPGFWKPITDCFPRRILVAGLDLSPKAGGLCRQQRGIFERVEADQRAYIADMAKGNPRIHVYDILPTFCDTEYCYQAGAEGAYFWTLQHVNEKGSARALKDFFEWTKTNLRHPMVAEH